MPDRSLKGLLVVLVLLTALPECVAQNVTREKQETDVVLAKLFQATYPPIARQTHISGDVELAVNIRVDGSVESAEVVTGHPLLRAVALNSIKRSQFECRNCATETTPFRIVYSFQLVGADTCCAQNEGIPSVTAQGEVLPRVVQSDHLVTIIDRATCICDAGPDSVKVRSVKCLYLWKCSVRFL